MTRLLSALLSFGLLFAGSAFAQESAYPRLKGSGFSLEELRSKIGGRALTVEQVLQLLPADLKAQSVLIRDSSSLQKARPPVRDGDMPLPRVILFGGKGLIAAFTDAALPGGNAIELLQFDGKSGWIPAEYTQAKGLELKAARCAECHGENTRPLWETYRCWPGAYGAVDDALTDREKSELARFVEGAPKHSRYKFLTNLKARFSEPEEGRPERLASSPNASLQDFIARMDVSRTARLIRNTPNYEQIKFALVGALRGCFYDTSFETFFSNEVWARLAPVFQDESLRAHLAYEKYRMFENAQCAAISYGHNELIFRTLIASQGRAPGQMFTPFDLNDT
ncbi:MAG TPA: hypothetical protein VFV50_00005, partial [Bdellovibrionales bacterium]|nr:hypothetical protein [Bdellovibrionales bacterium]